MPYISSAIDDLSDLSPLAIRLYVHIKRRVEEMGECNENTKTLAEACNMSVASISKAKKELQYYKLINVYSVPNDHGGRQHHVMTIDNS